MGKEKEREIEREKGREKPVSSFFCSHEIFFSSASATPSPLFGTFLRLNIFYFCQNIEQVHESLFKP